MKKILGIWLPDTDDHFKDQLPVGPMIDGKATYQYKKYVEALKYVDERQHAVDVGAHVGLWSRVMAKDFGKVTAFEPLALHRECFAKNVTSDNVKMIPKALGAASGVIKIYVPPENTGHAHKREDGDSCELVTLDSVGLPPVDFLKIDVEGMEHEVLKGAEAIIRCDHPVIIVEQKPDNVKRYGDSQKIAVNLLKGWGMKEAKVISGDHIMVWP